MNPDRTPKPPGQFDFICQNDLKQPKVGVSSIFKPAELHTPKVTPCLEKFVIIIIYWYMAAKSCISKTHNKEQTHYRKV